MMFKLDGTSLRNLQLLAIDLEEEIQIEYDEGMSEADLNDLVADLDARIHEAGIPNEIRKTMLARLYDMYLSDRNALESTYEYANRVLEAQNVLVYA